MSAEIVQVAITTIASGALAAVGAYVGVIWKLNSRVTKLEETVNALRSDQECLKEEQATAKREISDIILNIQAQQEAAKKEIINSIGVLGKEMSDFRVTCADNRSIMVRKKEFNAFTEEQERKWGEFYRLVGRLEGAMERLSKRPPALIPSSKHG